MTWQSDWSAAFGVFSRQLQYQRGDGPVKNVVGFSRKPATEEVAGNFSATTMIVVFRAADLETAGFYPPEQYDRVLLGDGVERSISAIEIDYVQATPQWCRVTVSG